MRAFVRVPMHTEVLAGGRKVGFSQTSDSGAVMGRTSDNLERSICTVWLLHVEAEQLWPTTTADIQMSGGRKCTRSRKAG